MKKYALLFLLFPFLGWAQVFEFSSTDGTAIHRILMDGEYVVETVFEKKQGQFKWTRGGFYTKNENGYVVEFEFNSNFKKDSLSSVVLKKTQAWELQKTERQQLNGKWLMAGRVQEEGEQRRDLTRSRKTMKFLLNGYFQWIAFDTKGLQFKGSGGGKYTASEGNYEETIQFFSRDDSKVGAVLPFTYVQKNRDWYHKGFSSKGKPMHEIWQLR